MEEIIKQLNKIFAERYSFSYSHTSDSKEYIEKLYETYEKILSELIQLNNNWDNIDNNIYNILIIKAGKEGMNKLKLFYEKNNKQMGPTQRLYNELNKLQTIKAHTIEEKREKLNAILEINEKIDILLNRYNINIPKILEKK